MTHIFLSFLFFNLILIIFYKHYKKGDYYINKTDLVFYTILFIAFGVYGGGEGDYFNYKMCVEEGVESLFDVYRENGMEIQYNYLAYILGGNYNLWRLVVYSVQFVGMSWLLYKAKLNTYPVLLCFVSICLYMSVYGRAFWGAIYYFLGVYLMIEKKNPLFLIVIALCYVSHTQNIVLLALLPLAFIDLKKWYFVVIIAAFGVIVTTFQEAFTSIVDSGGIEDMDYLNTKVQRYGNSGGLGAFGNSIGEVIMFILQHVPAVSIILYLLYVLFHSRKDYLLLYKPYRRIINIVFGIVFVSLVFLVGGMGSGALFYRVLAMIFFPISLLFPYLKEAKVIKPKTFNSLITIYIVAAELAYIKDLYYAYVGGRF